MADSAANDSERGLYRKYEVTRTDGSSDPGGKHHNCRYFVLDLDHDDYASAALIAYADACENEYPALAADLRQQVRDDRLMDGLYRAGWER